MAKRGRYSYNSCSKLTDSGTAEASDLAQTDYDSVVEFISSAFREGSKSKKEIESSLKRKFIFAKTEQKKYIPGFRKHVSRHQDRRHIAKLRCLSFTPRKQKYSDFEPLHKLWNSYIEDLLGTKEIKIPDVQNKLSRADLHGSYMKVTSSKCESFVGIEGIVVNETKNTFVLVTKENLSKRVPKSDTVFSITLPKPEGPLEVIGNCFLTRPAERSSKKIKSFIEQLSAKSHRKLMLPKSKAKTPRISIRPS